MSLCLGEYCAKHTLHYAAQSIEDGLRCEVLGRDEVDEVFLPVLLLWVGRCELRMYVGGARSAFLPAYLFDNLEDGWVCIFEVCRE